MKKSWTFVTLVLLGCSGPVGEGSDWKLSENSDQGENNETGGQNNTSLNNSTTNNASNNSDNNASNNSDNNTSSNNTTTSTNTQTNNTNSSCLPSVPVDHRSQPWECAAGRAPGTTPEFDGDWECQTDADCTQGRNGRCTGNGHDGWYCTYDMCDNDTECPGGNVCECSGGFRSDHNVCLPGNCTTDADCATGFCSPSQGDCGAYFGTVGYFCHTCEDECVNDSDCGSDGSPWGSYCMYDQGVGHWRCSDSQCAG